MNAVQQQLEPLQQPPKTVSRTKRWTLFFFVLLCAVFVPPFVTVNKFRRRLEGSMSAAVGSPVTVRRVHLRLLPAPGFELDQFAIQDDPAISAEPMLRAESVNATLRLTSLWRGRIEIARLDLKQPSLNLVRGPDGSWNIEKLLSHASQVPTAPTGNPTPGQRPRFPYIEAEGGRINFKIGQEKKVYALGDADFALWLASEDEWEMRLAGKPFRTDADLNDTGRLRITGQLNRSPAVRQNPLRMSINLEQAQLGQLSQLLYGRDRGWRGAVQLNAQLSGSPGLLNLAARISVRDFRRYDIATPDALNFEISCGAAYAAASTPAPPLSGAVHGSCTLPSGAGLLNLTGYYSGANGDANATLVAAAFPASAAVQFMRHMKRGMADDLTATGIINGTWFWQHSQPGLTAAPARPQISTLTAQVMLHSKLLQPDLKLGMLMLNLEQSPPQISSLHAKAGLSAPLTTILLLPVPIPVGGTSPLLLSAAADRSQYEISLRGEADLARLRSLLRALGLQGEVADGTGPARVDLRYAGPWAGFAAPVEMGSVKPELSPVIARRR